METIEQLRAALSAFGGVRLAVLFGSRARGSAAPASDVDVGVLLPASRADADDVLRALRRVTGARLDVTDLSTAPPLLRFEIARDGILLRESEPGVWSDFKARAMIDWWDWAPTAHAIHRAAIDRLREKAVNGPS